MCRRWGTGTSRTCSRTRAVRRKRPTVDCAAADSGNRNGNDMIKNRQKSSMRAFTAAIALGAAGAAGLWAAPAVAQTGKAPGPFTDAQAQAGQTVYNSRCASCHDAGGETIRLVGAGFTDTWKT